MKRLACHLVALPLLVPVALAVVGGPAAAGDICAPRTVGAVDAQWSESGPVLEFTVSSAGCAAGSVTFQTVAATAKANADFVPASGELSWTAGDATERTISVTIIDDVFAEPDEMLTLELSGAKGVSIGDASALGTIVDDERMGFVFLSRPFCPDTCVTCWLPLTASAPAEVDVTVHFATRDGTAVGGSDFAAVRDGRLTIPAGQTRAQIPISIYANTKVERDETFYVTIFRPSFGEIDNGTAVVTITDAR